MPIHLHVIKLGIVEGVHEYLPVSSTGHLILATELLGFNAGAWAVFNIAIQPGAILAVVVLYWRTFWDVFVGLFHRSPSAYAFVRNILVAFLPAAVLGVFLGDWIELLLDNAVVVAWALIIGGFAILAVERYASPSDCGGVANVTFRQSVMVGIVQCLAMIPGVSRSGATILGAMSFGVDRKLLPGGPDAHRGDSLPAVQALGQHPRRRARLDRGGQPGVLHRRLRGRQIVHGDRHPLRLRSVRLVPDRGRRRCPRLAVNALI